MGDSQKSYYQVSFSGTQALIALLVILVALALSFFFGAKAGFSRSRIVEQRAEAAVQATGQSTDSASPPAASASAPSSESDSSESATAEKPAVPAASSASGPIVTQTFEDREAGLPEEKAPPSSEIASSEASPSRTTISAPPKGGSKPSAGFYVQVLSTSSKAEAARWKEKLSARKYKAAVSPVDGKKGKLFRVRVGPYADKEQARKVAAKISADEKRQAWVAPAE